MGHTASPIRLLAPLALVAFGLAFFAIVLGSGTGVGQQAAQGRQTASGSPPDAARSQERPSRRRTGRRSYTVETGDTLGAIAERTGVPIEQLQDLNPDLDPQALTAGQKLKLRE